MTRGRKAARTKPSAPRRIVTAVPLCDGHDSAITTINAELVHHGWEVVYLGYHQAASAIARAAVQEDAHAIGVSSYNGGHVVFFRELWAQLVARGAEDVAVFAGGGGTITAADAKRLGRSGVRRVFFAGTSLDEMAKTMRDEVEVLRRPTGAARGDRALARTLSALERMDGERPPAKREREKIRRSKGPLTVGVAGPGGAGKSTLIDELVARFLRKEPGRRVAVLANDPSHPGGGALLGDRVSAIYAQDERVFFRSLATRGNASGLSRVAPAALSAVRESGEFDLVFVESVGIGQDGDPFGVFAGPTWVDRVLFVLPPHYGGRVQLEKIALLDGADLIALNKCDDPRATTAKAELTARLASSRTPRPLFPTIAARHEDTGVDELYAALVEGHEPAEGAA
jgi:methylmalonyl-CoA mutase